MSWKIVGHLNASGQTHAVRLPGATRTTYVEVYGPHPRKLWVGPHRVKGYRPHKPTLGPRPSGPTVAYQAEVYARWLAARDSVAIPEDCVAKIITTELVSEHRVTPSGRPKREERVTSVAFHKARESRHGTIEHATESTVTIYLPNWDFDPREPVEEIVESRPWNCTPYVTDSNAARRLEKALG